MNITSLARADQLIPMSKARAGLPGLVEKLDDVDFFVLVKKYQPQAVLVSLNFMSKLLKVPSVGQNQKLRLKPK